MTVSEWHGFLIGGSMGFAFGLFLGVYLIPWLVDASHRVRWHDR